MSISQPVRSNNMAPKPAIPAAALYVQGALLLASGTFGIFRPQDVVGGGTGDAVQEKPKFLAYASR